jgi:hypothetical protein
VVRSIGLRRIRHTIQVADINAHADNADIVA